MNDLLLDGMGRTLTIQAPNEFTAFGLNNKFALDGKPPNESWTVTTQQAYVAITGFQYGTGTGGLVVGAGDVVKVDFKFENRIYVSGIQCGHNCTIDTLVCTGTTIGK